MVSGTMSITDRKRKDKEEKTPKRGGEDFKVIFEEACKKVKENEDG